jgi:squalene-associated FAD-dependent desaturase
MPREWIVNTSDTIIIGGGLAGLATAVALAERGIPSTILESKTRLGGRASSFSDAETGTLIDACQHVSMGCCTAFASFCNTVGIRHLLEPQPVLWFMTPDGRTSRFARDPWPAPFHLGRALASAHYLTAIEKLRIAWGLARLALLPADADGPLAQWLVAHRQTPRTMERFWSVVLTSALNESLDRMGIKYARKVFVDAFLRDRDGFVVDVPRVPLGRLYGEELRGWLEQHGVSIRENAAVKRVLPADVAVTIELRNGETITAKQAVLAVPFERVLGLLPESMAAESFFARIGKLEASPITSVHVWYDREVMAMPHAVLVGAQGQWVFRRPGGYVQVVVSASRSRRALGRDALAAVMIDELAKLFPSAAAATVLRSKVVTEHTATFSAVPGVDALRPGQATPHPRLTLAGDWTDTGWPATMEGAVRSGNLAAGVVAEHIARNRSVNSSYSRTPFRLAADGP